VVRFVRLCRNTAEYQEWEYSFGVIQGGSDAGSIRNWSIPLVLFRVGLMLVLHIAFFKDVKQVFMASGDRSQSCN